MTRQRRSFSAEFKLEAATLVLEQERGGTTLNSKAIFNLQVARGLP